MNGIGGDSELQIRRRMHLSQGRQQASLSGLEMAQLFLDNGFQGFQGVFERIPKNFITNSLVAVPIDVS